MKPKMNFIQIRHTLNLGDNLNNLELNSPKMRKMNKRLSYKKKLIS